MFTDYVLAETHVRPNVGMPDWGIAEENKHKSQECGGSEMPTREAETRREGDKETGRAADVRV
jgi:hypothetical protein